MANLEAIIAAARQKVLERQQAQVTATLLPVVFPVHPLLASIIAPDNFCQAPTSCFMDETWPDDVVVVLPAKHLTLQSDLSAFQWNTEQLTGIRLARGGKSFIVIGAAGTGKTTLEKAICNLLVSENLVPIMNTSTKWLKQGLPGIVITSFTRRAVRNSRKAVTGDLKDHCVTLHKLLEYAPVFYEVQDEATGQVRNTMRFEPSRHKHNKLPASLRCIIIDESSMVSVELFKQLIEALPEPSKVQFIFVGDLHQLPPVYGQAILGFKLLDLPTVELIHIYRQAQESPIIALAHKIKDGKAVPVVEKQIIETPKGKITLHPWKKKISDFDAAHTINIFLRNLITEGHFDEEEDIILCPQEKTKNLAFGTNEFNRQMAQTLGELRGAEVWEVQAGYVKHYFAVGDRILVGREDAVITKINKNARYWGARPKAPSKELDRWGNYKKKVTTTDKDANNDDDLDIDKMLDSFSLDAPDEDRKQEASHAIEVELLDSGVKEVISTAGEINAAQFAYCLTVHKSQGSEWRRVFFFTHESHRMMWSRELLYTAITRAREELYMIVEPDKGSRRGTLNAAAQTPRIKGNTLAEKAEYFKGKKDDYFKKELGSK